MHAPPTHPAQESSTSYTLKCNISQEVNHLHEGIVLSLKDDREKSSEALGGRTALFKGSSVLTRLPPHLSVQLVRFFYRTDTRSKAKVLRKVQYVWARPCKPSSKAVQAHACSCVCF